MSTRQLIKALAVILLAGMIVAASVYFETPLAGAVAILLLVIVGLEERR